MNIISLWLDIWVCRFFAWKVWRKGSYQNQLFLKPNMGEELGMVSLVGRNLPQKPRGLSSILGTHMVEKTQLHKVIIWSLPQGIHDMYTHTHIHIHTHTHRINKIKWKNHLWKQVLFVILMWGLLLSRLSQCSPDWPRKQRHTSLCLPLELCGYRHAPISTNSLWGLFCLLGYLFTWDTVLLFTTVLLVFQDSFEFMAILSLPETTGMNHHIHAGFL